MHAIVDWSITNVKQQEKKFIFEKNLPKSRFVHPKFFKIP